MANLSIKYCGLNLKNPIIAASSGLTESVQNIKELEEAGIGAIVLKSIFEEEILMEMEQIKQQMSSRPYIFPETMDYMDALARGMERRVEEAPFYLKRFAEAHLLNKHQGIL